jgi:hypothetical protein
MKVVVQQKRRAQYLREDGYLAASRKDAAEFESVRSVINDQALLNKEDAESTEEHGGVKVNGGEFSRERRSRAMQNA